MRSLLLLSFLVFNAALMNAGTISPDSSTVTYRSYGEEAIEEFKVRKEFNYDKDPNYAGNPIKRLWYKFLERVFRGMSSGTRNAIWEVLKYGLMGLCILIIGRFLYRTSGSRAVSYTHLTLPTTPYV